MGLIKAALGAAGGTLANVPPIPREATTLSPPDPESQSQTDNV